MNYIPIPTDAVEIQKGLFWHIITKKVGDKFLAFGHLHSAQGYCFYQTTQAENYDEEGNLLPEEQLCYAIFASVPTTADLSQFVSVERKENYQVV